MKELRHLFISNFIKWASLMLWMALVFTVVYAVSFPDTPTWETAWWKFMNYFNAMLVNTWSSSDGTVKNSDKVDGLHASDLWWLSAATSWGSDKITLYWVTTCPTSAWWTKAYDWIMMSMSYGPIEWSNTEAVSTQVCVWNWRTERDDDFNWSQNGSYWFIPTGNYGVWTQNMTCAVCVR